VSMAVTVPSKSVMRMDGGSVRVPATAAAIALVRVTSVSADAPNRMPRRKKLYIRIPGMNTQTHHCPSKHWL
jgi:hypothetical protein